MQALRRQGWTISAMARRTCNQRPSLSCMTADLLPDPATGFGERVRQRLRDEQVIWFTTVGGDGTPQPNPVWLLWEEDSCLVYNRSDANRLTHGQSSPGVPAF